MVWHAKLEGEASKLLFHTQLTKAYMTKMSCNQLLLINPATYVYAHQDQFSSTCLSVLTLKTAHTVSGSMHREVLLCSVLLQASIFQTYTLFYNA